MKLFKSVEMFKSQSDFLFCMEKGLFETIKIWREIERVTESGMKWTCSWVRYALSPFPDCCGLVISHDAWLDKDNRGLGLGTYFHKERLKLMKDLGYSCGICTVLKDNIIERHVLGQNGWKKIHEFKNKRTGNDLEIWVKDIN